MTSTPRPPTPDAAAPGPGEGPEHPPFPVDPRPVAGPTRTGSPWTPARIQRDVLVSLGVVVAFVVVGAAAGWLWHQLWTPPEGIAVHHQWIPARGHSVRSLATNESSLGAAFGGTGLFILVGLGGGLLLGLITAFVLRRDELFAVAAVLVGSVLATMVCHLVGTHLGPPDPGAVARRSADFTAIPENLRVLGRVPYVMWTLGALLGVGLVYLTTTATRRTAELDADPGWLKPPQAG